MNIDELTKIGCDFRNAIISIPESQRPIGLKNFPHGACGDTAMLLGAFLNDSNILGFNYVHGIIGSHSKNTYRSHAWLQFKDIFIDLTADQFDDAPIELVLKASKWHGKFRNKEKRDSDFRNWKGPAIGELSAFYQLILEKLQPITL